MAYLNPTMQQNLHSRNVALVIGATGVTDTPLVEQLLTLSGWKVYGVSRRAPQLRAGIAPTHFIHVPVNVIDPRAARSALSVCTDVTHVYFCANDGSSEVRIAMLNNVLDAVDAVAIGFVNINLLQGTKYYGCHLGPFKSPAKESDPRLASGDFFTPRKTS